MLEGDRDDGIPRGLVALLGFILLFALGVSVWFFSEYQESNTKIRERAAEYQISYGNEGVEACRPIMAESGFIDWLACFTNAVEASQDAAYSKYDLEAQQDMAEWALGMFIASVSGVILTFSVRSWQFFALFTTRAEPLTPALEWFKRRMTALGPRLKQSA